jgi:hypothetical protein
LKKKDYNYAITDSPSSNPPLSNPIMEGFQVWKSIVDGYTSPTVPPTNDKAVKLGENNSKSINALLNGLSDTVFTKVAHCKSAKEIWDKLRNIYEGDSKVKAEKLQTYRG